MTVGMIIACVNGHSRFYAPVMSFSGLWMSFIQAKVSIGRLGCLLDDDVKFIPSEMVSKGSRASQKGIVLEDVTYRHKNAPENVIEKVSMEIEENSLVLIKGMSGAGKSTLLRLICGLAQPIEGRILVSGIELCQKRFPNAPSSFAVLTQEELILNDTVIGNLSYPGRSSCHVDVKSAAERSRIAALIERLPLGFETWLNGSGGLSRGEARRIAIGRLFTRNARVYLLDEPFAGIDMPTAQEIWTEIRQLTENSIVIVFDHDVKMLDGFDSVYEICNRTLQRMR